MSNNNDRRARIVFDVDPELQDRIRAKLSWGDTKKVYTVLTIQLVELLEKYDPELVKAGILSEEVRLSQLIDFKKPKV